MFSKFYLKFQIFQAEDTDTMEIIAFLIKYKNMTLENALSKIKGVRECVKPNIGF